MPDEYHPEFGEDSLEDFDATFDEGVEDFFGVTGQDGAWWEDEELWEGDSVGEWDDDEDDLPLEGADFGITNPFSPEARAKRQAARASRQAARATPGAVASRQQSAAEAQQALQAGAGIFSMFQPLIQAGVTQAQADSAAKRERRRRPPRRRPGRRPPRRPRPAPRRPAPQRPPPRQMVQRQMPMMQAPPPPGIALAADKKRKQMMLWIGLGTLGVAAVGTTVFFVTRKKK